MRIVSSRSFARLLAKIAYSYAVATYGLIPFENVFVLPLILGDADDASHWLGSAEFRLESERRGAPIGLASLWIPHPWDSKKQLLAVRIKLFAQSGATGYEVVVAWREPT